MNFWTPFDYINRLIDTLLTAFGLIKKDEGKTVIHARSVTIYNITNGTTEHADSEIKKELEEEVHDLTTILELEMDNNKISKK